MLDLFAGSGALGIEALSRGAAHATFVEDSPQALAVVEANVVACGLEERSTLVRADALTFLRQNPSEYDLALADPPYSFTQWEQLLGALSSAVVVIESDRQILDPRGYSEFGAVTYEVIRERRYGNTVVTIAVSRRRDDHGGRTEGRQ